MINDDANYATNQLFAIYELKDNWDFEGAKAIPREAISKTLEILTHLPITPDIFPTGRESVQIEWHWATYYFEIEIYEDHYSFFWTDDEYDSEERDCTMKEAILEFNKIRDKESNYEIPNTL